MKFLRSYIEEKIEIDDSEWEQVISLFTQKSYKKGGELHLAGVVCEKVYYISEGIARTYTIDTKGKDLTWALHYQKEDEALDPFAGDYISYVSGVESDFFCEVLCDSTVYEADFSELDKLYESDLKWMTLAKKISDMLLVTTMERKKMMYRLTAKEKYQLMQQVAPIYEKILPDYQFATVLGITPQSLSRLKREKLTKCE